MATPQEWWIGQKANFSQDLRDYADRYAQRRSGLQQAWPSGSLVSTAADSEPLKTWSLDDVPQANKDLILSAVVGMKNMNANINRALIDNPDMNPDTITANIARLQTEIDALKRGRAGEKTIMELRKEQVAALETKYASNLHTSWLGLWRPLSDQAQFGLGLFAFLFGAIAVGVLVHLGYTLYGGRLVGGGGGSVPTSSSSGGNFGIFE